jgi:hypothetical protein
MHVLGQTIWHSHAAAVVSDSCQLFAFEKVLAKRTDSFAPSEILWRCPDLSTPTSSLKFKVPSHTQWLCEIKFDGYRVNPSRKAYTQLVWTHHGRSAEAGGNATKNHSGGKYSCFPPAGRKYDCISPDIANRSNGGVVEASNWAANIPQVVVGSRPRENPG